MKDLVLGIDSGGSKTALYIADAEANIVFSSRGAGANPTDNPRWRTPFRTLMADAKEFLPRIAHACVSVGSFGESARVDAEVRAEFATLFDTIPLTIGNDVYIAHDAAFMGEAGILLIAGTGSMVVCCSSHGEMFRVGGFGPQFGDEGSAFWIGREALSHVTQALDGRGPETLLTQRIADALALDKDNLLSAILEWSARLTHARSQISALSKIAVQTAEDGDPVAIALMAQATDHLARHIRAARAIPGCEQADWSMLGGMRDSTTIVTALENAVGGHVPPKLPPWGGALWRAALNTNWLDKPGWVDRLSTNLFAAMRPTAHLSDLIEQGQE